MLFFVTVSIGILITGLSWNAYQVFSAVPEEDRSLLDRPFAGFRLIWPLIKVFCHYFGKYLSDSYRVLTDSKLKKAGIQYTLNPEQFFAAKAISAFVTLVVMFTFLLLIDPRFAYFAVLLSFAGFNYPDFWLRSITKSRQKELIRSMPFYLDVIILSIEAGTNLTGGITQAVQKSSESPLKAEFNRVLRDIRSGKTRADALRAMVDRTGVQSLSSIINGMIQAERSGSSLAPLLRVQADQLRSTRFLEAEKLAMEAPVKLLGPLILFIFPTTFLVLTFVVLSKAIGSGIITWEPLVWAYYWPG